MNKVSFILDGMQIKVNCLGIDIETTQLAGDYKMQKAVIRLAADHATDSVIELLDASPDNLVLATPQYRAEVFITKRYFGADVYNMEVRLWMFDYDD